MLNHGWNQPLNIPLIEKSSPPKCPPSGSRGFFSYLGILGWCTVHPDQVWSKSDNFHQCGVYHWQLEYLLREVCFFLNEIIKWNHLHNLYSKLLIVSGCLFFAFLIALLDIWYLQGPSNYQLWTHNQRKENTYHTSQGLKIVIFSIECGKP